MDEGQVVKKLSAEAKVGIFVFIGLVLLVYMSLKVGGIEIRREEGYRLSVKMDNVAGLDNDASILIAGVEVGRVEDITLDDNKARLLLRIKPDIKIGSDFSAVLKTRGLLGEKYLELVPGSPYAPALKEGDEITKTVTYTDMDQLITILSEVAEDVKLVTESLANVLGGAEGEATLGNIVKNIEDITYRVDSLLVKNEENLSLTMGNFAELSATLKEASSGLNAIVGENKSNIKEGIENLKNASLKLENAMEALNSLTTELSPEIKDTVASIKSVAKKIDEGQGTLGKLINDPSTHEKLDKTLGGINAYLEKGERFRTYLGYRGEYLFDEGDVKGYFSLRIQPKADKYYLLEVVDDPRGYTRTKEITVGGVTTQTTKTSERVKISAQIAKRLHNFTVRGGVIESTGGAAIDYYMFKDKIRLTFEAFDFDKDTRPHLKAGAMVNLNRYFFLTFGYDDFASKVGLESAYAGVGFQFEDEDLKYLFTSAPPLSF